MGTIYTEHTGGTPTCTAKAVCDDCHSEYKRGFNIRLNILFIMISLAYGLLFAILLLGYFFPGNTSPNGLPWFVWAAIIIGG